MKLTRQDILLVIVALLCLYNIFNISSVKTDIKGYKQKIEQLQTTVDSAKTVDKIITTKIDSVKDNVVNITKEIYYIDKNIKIIKKQTDEKVNSVDTLTANELEQFFTNRYDKGSN